MGKLRKAAGIAALGLLGPAVAAAIARQRIHSEGGEDSDDVRVVAIFDGERLRSHAAAFRGGSVIAWYGGAELDLRDARLAPDGARLRVVSLFGGAKVVVPADLPVTVRPIAVAGGVEADVDDPAGRRPALAIDAYAVFGGVAVTTRAGEDEDALLEPPATARAFERAEAEAAADAADPLEVETPADERGGG